MATPSGNEQDVRPSHMVSPVTGRLQEFSKDLSTQYGNWEVDPVSLYRSQVQASAPRPAGTVVYRGSPQMLFI